MKDEVYAKISAKFGCLFLVILPRGHIAKSPLNTHNKTIVPQVSDVSHEPIVSQVAEDFDKTINWLELDYVDIGPSIYNAVNYNLQIKNYRRKYIVNENNTI